jgi:putative radical SAM enzyme (TIGR03279 family)
MAGLPLPQRPSYEDLPQQENGVGSIRAFLADLDGATRQLPERLQRPRRISWVVGSLVGPSLGPVVQRLRQVQGLDLQLQSLASPYWGCEQVVTGLLTGHDLLTGLAGLDLGECLLLPSVLLRQGEPVFLDDLRLDQIEQSLGLPIEVVVGAAEVVAACLRA